MFVFQVGHYIVRSLLLRIELVQYFRPVCESFSSHFYNLFVTDVPMVCCQVGFLMCQPLRLPLKCLTRDVFVRAAVQYRADPV